MLSVSRARISETRRARRKGPLTRARAHFPPAQAAVAALFLEMAGRPQIDPRIPLLRTPYFQKVTIGIHEGQAYRQIILNGVNLKHFDIGTGTNKHLIVDPQFRTISGHHAMIVIDRGRVFLRDDSKNSTWLWAPTGDHSEHFLCAWRQLHPLGEMISIVDHLAFLVSYDLDGNLSVDITHFDGTLTIKPDRHKPDAYLISRNEEITQSSGHAGEGPIASQFQTIVWNAAPTPSPRWWQRLRGAWQKLTTQNKPR